MRTLLALAIAIALPAVAAAVPLQLSHQGRLSDATGTPLDGAHTLKLTLYDAPAGGSARWSDSFGLELQSGYYAVELGSGAPLDAGTFDGGSLYLAIAVDSAPELPDRLPLASVPYAFRALTAGGVSGGVVDATEIRVNGIPVVSADGTLLTLPDGGEDSDTLADLGCGVGNVPSYGLSGWGCAALDEHTHDASAVTSGTLDVSRLPIGTGSSEVAAGDHTHDAAAITSGTLLIARLPVGTDSESIAAGDHKHTAKDVGALPDTTTAADLGALPLAGGKLVGALSGTDATFSGGGSFKGVTVGDPGDAACQSTTEGLVRWNGDELQACDGKEWLTYVVIASTKGLDERNPSTDCKQIKADDASLPDGTYWIDPDGPGGWEPFRAWCDMTTNGGGWTLVMTVAPSDGNSVGYNNQAFWVANAPYGAYEARFGNDFKSPAAFLLKADHLLITSVDVYTGNQLGWRRWPMTAKRTLDSFFSAGIVGVHGTDSCETQPSDLQSVGTTSSWDDIIRQGSCLYADVNPSSSGWGDTIRLTTIPANNQDNRMSGFASCIDCGTPWQSTNGDYMGRDRAPCNSGGCAYNGICKLQGVDCRGNYCNGTYGETACDALWNSRFYVR